MRKKRKLIAAALCFTTVIMSAVPAFAEEKGDGDVAVEMQETKPYIMEKPQQDGWGNLETTIDNEETAQTLQFIEEKIPDAIRDEIGIEEQNGKRVPEDEKNLNTIVYENESGTKTMYLFEKPVKYVDDEGNIRDKSTTFEKS